MLTLISLLTLTFLLTVDTQNECVESRSVHHLTKALATTKADGKGVHVWLRMRCRHESEAETGSRLGCGLGWRRAVSVRVRVRVIGGRVPVCADGKFYREGDDEGEGRRANAQDGKNELRRSTCIVRPTTRVMNMAKVRAWAVLWRKRENGGEGQAGCETSWESGQGELAVAGVSSE